MTDRLELTAGAARAALLPGRGAAMAGLWVGDRPVLRPAGGRPGDGPFAVSNILLAPFSNRVSRPFEWGGRRRPLPRNMAAEPCPIHGDAFQRPWSVAERGPGHARLELPAGGVGPLLYAARLSCTLSPGGFSAELTLTSQADEPMPFGLGFHPWFPRNAGTRLEFSASGVWQEGEGHLPARERPDPITPDRDFSSARALPAGWVNHGFSGWDGTVGIDQGAEAVPVTMRASANLDTLIVYSPDESSDFFCAEPVSHPVDAFNLPGMPGLSILDPGESMTARMELEWTG